VYPARLQIRNGEDSTHRELRQFATAFMSYRLSYLQTRRTNASVLAILFATNHLLVDLARAEVVYWGLPAKFAGGVVNAFDSTADAHRLIRPWIVCAGMPFHETFSKPDSGSPRERHAIGFGDCFYVSDQRSGYMHIYHDLDIGPDMKASIHAEDFGWVSAGDMLLWNHCLVTSNRVNKKIYVYGINDNWQIFVDEPSINWQERGSQSDDRYAFRVMPSDAQTVGRSSHEAGPLEVYYLYKVSNDGKFYLLGPSPLNKGHNSILGWLPKDLCVSWFNRVALEPNWDPEAEDERLNHHSEIRIFLNQSDANAWACGSPVDENRVLYESDPIKLCMGIPDDKRQNYFREGRPVGSWLRFPLLDMVQSGGVQLIKCGVVGEFVHEDCQTEFGWQWNKRPAIRDPRVYPYTDQVFILLGMPDTVFSPPVGCRIRFWTQGYTVFQRKDDQFPLYKPVLFMATDELNYALYDIKKLISKSLDDREELYYACQELLESYGGKLDKDANIDNVLNYVMGELPTRHHELFGNVKISEIMNEQVFTDADLAKWNNEFGKLFQKLDAIRSDPNFPRKYKYVEFGSEGSEGIQRDYYWIDEEIIP